MFSLVVLPELIHALAKQLLEKRHVITISHLLIKLSYETVVLQSVAIIQKHSRNVVPLVPLIALPRFDPTTRRWGQTSSQPNEIRNPFNQSTRDTFPLLATEPLPHVRHLVIHHPGHLTPDVIAAVGVVPHVVGAETDLVVHGVRHAVHVLHQQRHVGELSTAAVGRLAEDTRPYEIGGVGHDVAGVVGADVAREDSAAGCFRRGVDGGEVHHFAGHVRGMGGGDAGKGNQERKKEKVLRHVYVC
ncbi:unnamed protein product [Linum tenue]|uniref:Uncharacterized protein n=1 Tax=Linum tenue TaxID=586396 RepID=A0AAV0NPX8_9ROSI|nr:unnamed protein product [Linum tenue]